MSRVKKNRKSGSTVTPRSNDSKPKANRSEAVKYSKKRGKGLSPGSRQNEAELANGSGRGGAKNKDPRHGSKKKVSLFAPVKDEQVTPIVHKQPKKLSPEQELEQLEQNPRLMELLDRLDEQQAISAEDKKWLDEQTARHEHLLDVLGLLEDDEELDDGDLGSYLNES